MNCEPIDFADGHSGICRSKCTRGRVTVHPAIGKREREILLAWFRHETKSEAARVMFVSVNTVKKHIERVRAKYADAGRPAPTQALLVIRAIEDGWLDIDSW